jgi:hypothetical protein
MKLIQIATIKTRKPRLISVSGCSLLSNNLMAIYNFCIEAQGKNVTQALDTFTQVCHKALKAVGKTAVVWEGKSSASAFQVYVADKISRDGPRSSSHTR